MKKGVKNVPPRKGPSFSLSHDEQPICFGMILFAFAEKRAGTMNTANVFFVQTHLRAEFEVTTLC